MADTERTRLAVLIDADNASASVAKELLEEIAKYGTATVKRAYGDWTTQNLAVRPTTSQQERASDSRPPWEPATCWSRSNGNDGTVAR